MTKILKIGTFFLFSLLVIFSCEKPPCENYNGAQLNLGFFESDGTTLIAKSIDSLTVYAGNAFYDGSTLSLTTLALTLSNSKDQSEFIFLFKDGRSDTLVFNYLRETKLVSHECGFVNFYTLTGVTTTTNVIDSVWVRKELVEYGKEENCKIYF
jgi:hypothetical protein